ncbi:MAG: LysM domain-containing protein, partial [Candidatus Promineifilaceae bacterium]
MTLLNHKVHHILLTLIILLPLSLLLGAAVQNPAPIAHFIEPGDTWQALAWRYGVETAELQAASRNPNPLM